MIGSVLGLALAVPTVAMFDRLIPIARSRSR
jgi:hypothetical protein